MLKWTWGCIYLFGMMLSFPLAICPEVWLLDHVVISFLIFWVASILLTKMAETIYIPTNSSQGLPFLCILINTCVLCLVLISEWWCIEWAWKCSFLCSFWNNFRRIGINSSLNVWYTILVKPSVPGFLFVGSFWVIDSILVLVTGLFIFSVSSDSVLGDHAFLRICPFLPGCSFYWHIVACSILLWSILFLWCQF